MKKIGTVIGNTAMDIVRNTLKIVGGLVALFWMVGSMYHMIVVTTLMLAGEERSFISEVDAMGGNALFWEKVLFSAEIFFWIIFFLVLCVSMAHKHLMKVESSKH